MTKFLFTADIHANKTRLENVIKFFDKVKQIITDNKIDYFIIGGDLWDLPVSNSKASGFVDVLKKLEEISQITKIVSIYGTPSHEAAGSIDFINALGGTVVTKPELHTFGDMKVLCIPEPRRSDYIMPSAQETTDAILKDLSEVCNQKADLIIFHGEVKGSRLQNGVLSKSDVQLTKGMIDSTGAKLVLCGHIHQPQVIDDKIYYVGSPIPCNFGETHKGTVITFSYDGEVKDFKRVELGFPINKTVDCDRVCFDRLFNMNFKDSNVKVNLSLTPDERKLFHIHDEAKKLQEATGADKITISISTAKEVSVRSREIAKTVSILEKLKIYASVNSIELTDSILEKARFIEDNMLIKYSFPSHSFELQSISLRGAKGIVGKEEIFIDFNKYEDGVLAIVGKNGSGKSTLLENCHPFPCLLTRGGSLRNHFYLKDSHRIIIFKDENDKLYKFTIQLAAHTENGLVKYFAETSKDNGTTWIACPETDGNLDSYKTFVEGLFGSLNQYLKTAFFTTEKTKGYNDIATATKSERIELLSELLGTDSLSAMHDMIKENLKNLSNDIERYSGFEEEKEKCNVSLSEKRNARGYLANTLIELEEELEAVENEIKSTKKKQDEYNKNFAKFGDAIKLKNECENRILEVTEHLDKLKEHKIKNDFYKNYSKEIEEYKNTYEKSKPLQDKINKLSKELHEVSTSLFDVNNQFNDSKFKYDNELRKLDGIDEKIKNTEARAVDVIDVCPTCGSKLSEKKKKELLKVNETVQDEIKALEDFKNVQKDIVAGCKKEYNSLKEKVARIKTKKNTIEAEYNDLDGSFTATQVYLDMNEQYLPYIDYVPVTNLETDIKRYQMELDNQKQLLDSLSGVEIIDYEAILDELELKRKDKENDRLKFSMDLSSINTQILQLEETLKAFDEQETILSKLSKEYEEYSILEQAFSNSGIQALELEAAAPSIAELTNSILHDSYGDKFSISFSTLKQGRNKLIDDFAIDVTNHETGWTTEIELLSKGEKVWIMQSLYFAFSIIRQEKTNFSFKVRFIDESDGGLDGDIRLKYLNMIQSAHKNGGSRLTVLVTHSQEIKDIVTQTIDMNS